MEFVSIRQLEVEPDGHLFDIERQDDGLAGDHAGGARAIVGCCNFSKLAGNGWILKVWCEILEPEDRLDCQTLQVLKKSQGCGRHSTECRYIVGPGESSRDRPFEEGHTFLGDN